jgi:uncharacterized protein YcgL (UPF0745 family)
MTVLTQVYASERKPGFYLYVPKDTDLTEVVPASVLNPLGTLRSALLLMLTHDKVLAQADGKTILAAFETQGFYLQLPPPVDLLEMRYS